MRAVADGHFVACHFPLVGDVAPAGDPVAIAEAAPSA
jgi:hypothetical protein